MKRLRFNQSLDKTKLYTNEIFCSKDVLKGEIVLDSDKIMWYIIDSLGNTLDSGNSKTVAKAQEEVKKALIQQGATFGREHRKYRI